MSLREFHTTALNSVPAQAGKGPRLELPDVVEGDVEEVEVADAGEGVLFDLGDAVVADVQVAEVAHVGEDLPVEAAELVGGEVERLQPRQVEDVPLHGVGYQLVAAQVELGEGREVGQGVPGTW